MEQEYSLFEKKNFFVQKALGWPVEGFPDKEGPYYCSVGSTLCFGRAIMNAHYRACLYANIKISSANAEVMPGQWEFKLGPCFGLEVGD